MPPRESKRKREEKSKTETDGNENDLNSSFEAFIPKRQNK